MEENSNKGVEMTAESTYYECGEREHNKEIWATCKMPPKRGKRSGSASKSGDDTRRVSVDGQEGGDEELGNQGLDDRQDNDDEEEDVSGEEGSDDVSNKSNEEERETRKDERKRSEEFLKRYNSATEGKGLNEIDLMALELWCSSLFHNYKYITDAMLVDETRTTSIMTQAFDRLSFHTELLRSQKREAVKKFLKRRVGRARDFFRKV